MKNCNYSIIFKKCQTIIISIIVFVCFTLLFNMSANAGEMDISSFSVLAKKNVYINNNAEVKSGNVGAKDSGSEAVFGNDAYLSTGVSVYADTIKIEESGSVDDVYYNELNNNGTIRGEQNTPLTIPLDVTFPEYPTPDPGDQDKEIGSGQSVTLDAGSYGTIRMSTGATLVFSGGTYHIEALSAADASDSSIIFQKETELIINDKIRAGSGFTISPDYESGINSSGSIIYVFGSEKEGKRNPDVSTEQYGSGKGRTSYAVTIADKSTIHANIYAPNGTIWIDAEADVEGALIGQEVYVGEEGVISLNSGFYDTQSGGVGGGGGGSTPPGSNKEELYVIYTEPPDEESNVPLDTVVTAHFSLLLNGYSADTDSFTLKEGENEVTGSVSTNGNAVSFTPSEQLSPDTEYTAMITKKLRAANFAGTTLDSNYSWTFTTTDSFVTPTPVITPIPSPTPVVTITPSPSPTPTVSPAPVASPTPELVDLDQGLQVYYSFDQKYGSIATDSSDNGNDGIVNGAIWVKGKINGGLFFDGADDFLSVPVINSDEVTVAAWFYKVKNDTEFADVILEAGRFDIYKQNKEGFELLFSQTNSEMLQFILTTENEGGLKTIRAAKGKLKRAMHQWYHFAGTYNMSTGEQRIYINGEMKNKAVHPAGNFIAPLVYYSDMKLSGSNYKNGYFGGIIDDFRLYNRALSAQEIEELYNTE